MESIDLSGPPQRTGRHKGADGLIAASLDSALRSFSAIGMGRGALLGVAPQENPRRRILARALHGGMGSARQRRGQLPDLLQDAEPRQASRPGAITDP